MINEQYAKLINMDKLYLIKQYQVQHHFMVEKISLLKKIQKNIFLV